MNDELRDLAHAALEPEADEWYSADEILAGNPARSDAALMAAATPGTILSLLDAQYRLEGDEPAAGVIPVTATIMVLIPVLGRPERVAPLVDSLSESATLTDVKPLFLVSPDDHEEQEAIRASRSPFYVVPWDASIGGDYSRKINLGFHVTSSPFVFLAADDLIFHPGWAERALACHLETRACVVGTVDGGNRSTATGEASTHTLICRSYGECGTADEDGKILHEGYDHNFCDTELVATARARRTFASASDCLVEHLHPIWGKAEFDDTYRKGLARFNEDREHFEGRRHLWESL